MYLNKLNFLALGDCYTCGEKISPKFSWPMQLVRALRNNGFDYEDPVIVAKIGWTTDELKAAIREALEKQVIKPPYNLVSLSIGVNNQYRNRSIENFKEEFEELLDIALSFANLDKSRVMVLSIPDYGCTPYAEKRNHMDASEKIFQFNAAANIITQKKGIDFIDITPFTMKKNLSQSMMAHDGLHYAPEMYHLWVHEILRQHFHMSS